MATGFESKTITVASNDIAGAPSTPPGLGAVTDQLEAVVADCKAAWLMFSKGQEPDITSMQEVTADRLTRLHDLIFELRILANEISSRA